MAAEERGSLTIEDDVVVKGNKKNGTWVHCHPIHVFITVILVLFILAIVGVMTYFLPKRKCPTNDMKSTIQPRATTDSMTKYREGSTYIYPTDATSEWSSDGFQRQPEIEGPWQGRLSMSVIPLRYNLSIAPYFYPEDVPTGRQRFTFDGNVSIAIQCKESTSQITLHTLSINISELSVFRLYTDEVDIADGYEEDHYFEFLKIDLSEELIVDSIYVIKIVYGGVIQEEPLGFYKISYKDENGDTRWGGVTTMQPTSARKATPCFDEPEFKAEFDVTIRHRSDMTALSNGIELSITDLGGTMSGWRETVFKTTPKMSSYLLAFAVTHFVSLNQTTDSGTLVRVWSKPQDINHTLYALDSAVKQTTFFESYFNYGFPLEKQDMIAVPRFIALAMENWGLIVYHESAMIYNPEKHSLHKKEQVAMVVSHELAHQWFGNLVTPAWWDDLWLNEGFARYTEYLGVDYCEPQWKTRAELFLDHNFLTAMRLDSTSESHPVRQDVNTPEEIFSLFDTITYNKGATVIRMLVNMLSEDVFIAGLQDYLKVHAYDNTNTEDLWESLTKADISHGGNDIKVVMDTWTLQPFYPLVTFNRTTDSTISASQIVFLSDDDAKEKYDNYRPTYGNITWEILISHTHESEINFENPTKDWMHGEENVEVTLSAGVQPTDWYLVNIGRYGYYRVNYDTTNWNRLSEQLLKNHEAIPVQNRFQLLDDAGVLFQTDELDIHIILNLTLYLHQELEYLPWKAAVFIAGSLRSLLKLQPSYGLFENYWLQKLLPVYRHLGWESNNINEYPKTLIHRVQTIEAACFFRDEDCLQAAKELYAEYMADPTNNPIPESSELRRYAYCFAILQGGQKEWEFGMEQFLSLSSEEQNRENHWIYGLTCSTQPWLLNRLLQDAYDGKLEKYRAFNIVVRYMAGHDIGLPVVWEYIQQNWKEMWNSYDNDVSFSWVLQDIGHHFSTELHLQQLLDFGEKHDFVSGSYVEVKYKWAVNRVKYTIEMRERYTDDVTKWLSQHII